MRTFCTLVLTVDVILNAIEISSGMPPKERDFLTDFGKSSQHAGHEEIPSGMPPKERDFLSNFGRSSQRTDPQESVHPHQERAIRPKLEFNLSRNVQKYEDNHQLPFPQKLPIDREFQVEVADGYIIGYVLHERLYPFRSRNVFDWIKVRIDGMVNEPVSAYDSFRNQFFYHYGRPAENIRYAIRH